MPVLSLVGSPPSCGSTFLADLLDSSPVSACGSELNFFSNKAVFNFDNFKQNPGSKSPIHAISVTGVFPNYDVLEKEYGLTSDALLQLIYDSDSFEEFSQRFAGHFLAIRGRNSKGVVFSKTPQNLNSIGEFLKSSRKGHYIFIVRNPLYVYQSMRKRGFGIYQSLYTWLVDVAKYWQWKNHPRVITIRYEDLVAQPFQIAAGVISKQKPEIMVGPELVQKHYENNLFRASSGRIESWTVTKYGKIFNANTKKFPVHYLAHFLSALPATINPNYAALHDLATITYPEAIKWFGYDSMLGDLLQKVELTPSAIISKYNSRDFRKLIAKWSRDFLKGQIGLKDMRAYLQPVIPLDQKEIFF